MILAVFTLVSLAGCKKDEPIEMADNTDAVVYVKFGDNEYILHNTAKSEYTLYVNGETYSNYTGDYQTKPYMKLPEAKGKADLSSYPTVTENVYEANKQVGVNYIEGLELEGYTYKIYAATQDYVEVYMVNPNKTSIKRVIITDNWLMAVDVDSVPEFKIEDYLYK